MLGKAIASQLAERFHLLQEAERLRRGFAEFTSRRCPDAALRQPFTVTKAVQRCHVRSDSGCKNIATKYSVVSCSDAGKSRS